jgi:YHS domain-containing protein
MNRLSLGLLTIAFAFTLNLTWSQVKTDSSLVKNPVVTKSIDTKKVDVTKSVNTKNVDVTKPINEKKIDVTKPINGKKIDVTKPIPLVTKGTGKPVNKLCIVSGEEIDSKVTADYKGVTYAFCCKTCLKKFTANPEKYVAKLDKETSKSKN